MKISFDLETLEDRRLNIFNSAFVPLKAFSLIEIMVGLIVVSIMVAAFAPVITKKVSNTTVALSQQDNVAGKVIKSKLYNFSTALNGVDGCSLVDYNTALKCPFDVPEDVTSVNFILVSGGGGGAGGGANSTITTPINLSNGESKTIPIDKYMRNVKISFMASGGGGGGGGYYYYNYTPASIIHPKSQSDCDKIGANLYYVSAAQSCVTKYNLYEKSINASFQSNITSLKAGTNYNSNSHQFGDKICWSTTGSFNVGFSEHVFKSTSNAYQDYYKTDVRNMPDYPVCTYPAAKYICDNYGYGTTYNGKWRLPNATEASWIAQNHPNKVYAFKADGANVYKGRVCDPGYYANSLKVNQYRFQDKGAGASNANVVRPNPNNLDYFRNICLPEYVWGENKNYYLLKPEASSYTYVTASGWNGAYYVANIYSVRATFDDCIDYSSQFDMYGSVTFSGCNGCSVYTDTLNKIKSGHGCLNFISKDYAPFSVRCAIDNIGTKAATYTYNHASGGGGGSGQYVSNISIPQSVINSAIGGYIYVRAGAGGSGGNGSSNGGTSYNGSDGGVSYVHVYDKYGDYVWEAYIDGGKGGGKGTSTSAGSGASARDYFLLYNYNSGPKSDTPESHIKGNPGSNGTRQEFSGSAPGGYGGPAVNGYGQGGSGGAASDQSAEKGSNGNGGYVSMSYETTYLGAPGGGGAGGKIVRYEGIKVTEGSRIWVKVGGGGYAGSNSNGGNGGQSAFDSYYVNGGGGGLRGVNQTGSTNPSPGGAGSVIGGATTSGAIFFKDGSNGGAASIDYSNLRGTGGVGGNGGLNNYYLGIGKGYTDLSIGCGGYYSNTTYLCDNTVNKNASYTGDEFANPGKVHREGSTKYGSAGSGGGGGGIDPNSTTPGAASRGQDGYVYIWWEDFAD